MNYQKNTDYTIDKERMVRRELSARQTMESPSPLITEELEDIRKTD